MKKLILLYFSIFLGIYASGFELKKVSEFAKSEKFINSQSGLIFHKNHIYVLSYSGLLIFELNEKGVPAMVNKIRLNGIPTTMTVHDSVLFVALQGGFDLLYKINISDAKNAFIVDSISGKGSYIHFISENFLFVNELSNKNTWQLAKYDFNFNLITKIKIPHDYWALQKAGNQAFFIHKKDSLFLYTLKDSNLNLKSTSYLNENQIIRKIEIINDTLLFIALNSNLNFYNITDAKGWKLISSLDPVDDFRISGGSVILKSNNQISTFNIEDAYNLIFKNSLSLKSYITSFSVNKDYLWVSTFSNELCTYHGSNDGFKFINTFSDQKRIIASALNNNQLLVETDDNKLHFWNIKDVESPHIDSVVETKNHCLKLIYKDGVFQRVYYDPVKKRVGQSLFAAGSNSHFKKISASNNYKGDLHSYNTNFDTLISFYNGQLFFYRYFENNIFTFDSIEVCKAIYGKILVNDNIVFLATKDKLFCIEIQNNIKSIKELSKFATFIPLPNILKYDSSIIISDRSCNGSCKLIDYSNMRFPFIKRTLNEAGPIVLDRKSKALIIGCKNTAIFYMDEKSEYRTNNNDLFQDYSNRLNSYIYTFGGKKYLITVKETGLYINSFN